MNRIVQFAEALSKRTEEGKLRWRPTERRDEYQLAFLDYAVRVGKRMANATAPAKASVMSNAVPVGVAEPLAEREQKVEVNTLHYLLIYNEHGQLIEEVNERDLAREDAGSSSLIENTYRLARRQAMGFDEAIDALLIELA